MLAPNIEANVGLVQTTYTVDEDNTRVEVCVRVTGPNASCPIGFTFILSLSSLNHGSAGAAVCMFQSDVITCYLSADADSDYQSVHKDLTFTVCSKGECGYVDIIDDVTVEEIESFDLTLESLPGVNSHVILELNKTNITIVDNDSKQVEYVACRVSRQCLYGVCVQLNWCTLMDRLNIYDHYRYQ